MSLREAVLRRLEIDPSLAGDLIEQTHRGRSIFWFWRQVWFAAASAACQQILARKPLAVRALVVGAVTVAALRKLAWWPMQAASSVFGVSVGNYLLETGHDSLRWVFMRYHLFNLPAVVATCLVYGAAGYLVGVTHRRHRSAMVLLFAVTAQLWWMFGLIALTRNAMVIPQMNLYPFIEAITAIVLFPTIMTAALWTSDGQIHPAAPDAE
jgi:hypothetical protein